MANPLGDDLDRPLGADLDQGVALEIPYWGIGIAGFAALAASLAAFVYVTGDGLGGQPVAIAQIDIPHRTTLSVAGLAPLSASAAQPGDIVGAITGPKRVATGDEIEQDSGVRVTRPRGLTAPGALIIDVANALRTRLAPAPDTRLLERFAGGALPRVGADGSRAADVYARPAVLPAGLKQNAPRIAVVIGGIGLSRDGTSAAVARLPGAVTLAFAPYGSQLAAEAAQARDAGHEILLQAPMEPFDYPNNDPGPQTLVAAPDPGQNLTRLHWLMGRFSGYVGVASFLGAKFTADAEAFTPILRDIADRGLIYVDDGTSARSLTRELAAGLDLPVALTDVVVDSVPRADAIDAALARLEAVARERGTAVGSANGLPVTLDRIARWAPGLEARGIALVPVSALAQRLGSLSGKRASNGR